MIFNNGWVLTTTYFRSAIETKICHKLFLSVCQYYGDIHVQIQLKGITYSFFFKL